MIRTQITGIAKRCIAMFAALLVVASGVAFAYPAPAALALTENQKEVCEAIGSPDCQTDPTGAKDPNALIESGIDIFSAILGIIAVIMIMVAGFKYITSSGDSSKISSAKSTLIYAIIGLIIVVLSQTIVKFVIDKIA